MTDYAKSIELYNDGIGKVEYVSHMGTDLTVCNSARVSFGNEKEALDERDCKLINYLIRHRHTSTLEHNVITFRFSVPLFVRSQHHRHRTWSYNESHGGILMLISDFMSQTHSEPNTNQTDKRPTPKN